MKNNRSIKVVMIPWLAMGHLTPFLELSKTLAKKGGIHIYFITTPKNIPKLAKIPTNLTNSITIIPIPLPHLDKVPDDAESSMNVPSVIQPWLKARFDLLETPISNFLEQLRPDWVLYDFTSHWIPSLAAKTGASSVYISLFNAATMAFIGPPSALLGGMNARVSLDDYTVAPKWIPFESDIVYRGYEVLKFEHSVDADVATPDTVRFGNAVEGCDVVGIRSLVEFEPEWIDLLESLYGKKIIPLGSLFPDFAGDDDRVDENWNILKKWLDKQNPDSVLYAALGSESTLSQDEIHELSLGLEHSGLPFILVLRDPPGSDTKNVLEMLPEGFEKRLSGQGLVQRGWAPQLKILSHPAIRGFLTHCGWNSVIEGLGLGKVLVLLPIMNDQGLVARLLVGKGLGVEIERDEKDGFLRRACVDKAVRLAMVEEEGEMVRVSCRGMNSVLGNVELNGHYIQGFVDFLEQHDKSS